MSGVGFAFQQSGLAGLAGLAAMWAFLAWIVYSEVRGFLEETAARKARRRKFQDIRCGGPGQGD